MGVRRIGDSVEQGSGNRVPRAGLGDLIAVRVQHLQDLVNHADCLSADQRPVPGCLEQDISLYLDGREIKGLKPESGAPLPQVEELQFHLARTPESDEAWADLLGNPPLTEDRFFTRPTALSVGLSGAYALPSDVGTTVSKFELVRLRKGWFIWSSIVMLLVLFALLFWGASSTLLRDPGPVTKLEDKNTYPPYSLGRVQMAFWFVLVTFSFVYIWLVTGGWDTITGSVLGLIGIGAGTALGAAVIDTHKGDTGAAARRSEQFLDDVLTDADGYSFHRFQMFTWTIVLGVLFVYSVWQRLSMPEFSATLLGLLGISSGTYLGFKIPEKQP